MRIDFIIILVFSMSWWCIGNDRGPRRFLYFMKESGKCLRRNILKTHYYNSEMGCLMACQNNQKCMSVNVKKEDQGNQVLCELNDNRKSLAKSLDFHTDPHFDYFELQTMHPMMDGRMILRPASSCKELYSRHELFGSGIYPIQSGSKSYPTYCVPSIKHCKKGGWTLIAKIDGRKSTFKYDSPLWTKKKVYNLENVMKGLDWSETLQPTYWHTSLDYICLGMRSNKKLNWLLLPVPSSRSLYHLINSTYTMDLHLSNWSSLIEEHSLRGDYIKQGINMVDDKTNLRVRIGAMSGNKTCSKNLISNETAGHGNETVSYNGTISGNGTFSGNGTVLSNVTYTGNNTSLYNGTCKGTLYNRTTLDNGTYYENITCLNNETYTGNETFPLQRNSTCSGTFFDRIGIGLGGFLGDIESEISSGFQTYDNSTNQETDIPAIMYILVQ